jgi:hypothetical protein
MSLPNSLALCASHSRRSGRGGRPGGGLGSSLSGSAGTRHFPRLGKRSAGVASAATTQQGRGAGAVSPMAYSTPARSLTFSKVLAMSQGHSVSSLSQSQSTLAARRKGDARQLKGNIATKKRSESDTDNGSPQKGNAAKKKRGKLGAGHKAAGKGTANTDTGDDAGDNDKEGRRGKSDAWDEAEYDDEDDVLPVTDAPFGVRQRNARRLAEFNTAAVVVAYWLEFMQRAFPPQPANVGKTKTQGAAAVSIKACRPQSEVDYIVYILMHWQVDVRLTELNPGTERDRLQLFRRKHRNRPKITAKYCLEQIQVPHEEPCIVQRRRELDEDGKKDAGRIVVSREQVFDAIDEWH